MCSSDPPMSTAGLIQRRPLTDSLGVPPIHQTVPPFEGFIFINVMGMIYLMPPPLVSLNTKLSFHLVFMHNVDAVVDFTGDKYIQT